jgi:hypothetical protein
MLRRVSVQVQQFHAKDSAQQRDRSKVKDSKMNVKILVLFPSISEYGGLIDLIIPTLKSSSTSFVTSMKFGGEGFTIFLVYLSV